MLSLARWCIAHRRRVAVAWLAVAILTTVLAGAAGRDYASVFSLPGTQSQKALNLLKREFPTQSGDVDTIVFHVSRGTIDAPGVRAVIAPMLARVSRLPHVVGVISPYGPRGAVEVARNRMTAFATVNFDRPANQLPNATGTPVLDQIDAIHLPGLKVAAGGQVIEDAEGFSVGPATEVGVVAAMVILLLTFGSLLAAGMPLITAGLGLITGVALIGLATHVTSMSNVSPELALMIGLGVGIDYSLFIVTRFRENYVRSGEIERSIVEAMDTSGRAILLAGTTVVIALLGMFATGVSVHVRARDRRGDRRAADAGRVADAAAGAAVVVRPPARAPARRPAGARSAAAGPGDGTAPAAAPAIAHGSAWRRWSEIVQARPWPLALASLAVMILVLSPVFAMRLDSSDAGNDPANTSSRHAFDLLARGFGPGFNGPLLLVAELPLVGQRRSAARRSGPLLPPVPDVVAVTPPRISPSGTCGGDGGLPRARPRRRRRPPTSSTGCATRCCRRSPTGPA